MGGSYYYNDGGRNGIDLNSYCANQFKFQVILNGNEQTIWENVNIDDDVIIWIKQIESLPALCVIRKEDKLQLGQVPAEYSRLLDCIHKGWKYAGKVVNIEGDELQPLIYVNVWGQKDI